MDEAIIESYNGEIHENELVFLRVLLDVDIIQGEIAKDILKKHIEVIDAYKAKIQYLLEVKNG